MSKYFSNPGDLKTIGRALKGAFTIEGLKSQLKENEVLIGLFFHNGAYWVAPVLNDQPTYDYFEQRSVGASSFYALDKSLMAGRMSE